MRQRRRQQQLETAYEGGRRAGFEEALPFHGIKRFARFPRTEPSYKAVAEYERSLLDSILEAYAAIELAKRRLDDLEQPRADPLPPALGDSHRSRKPGGSGRASRRHAQETMRIGGAVRDAEREVRDASGARDSLVAELKEVRSWLDAFVYAAEEYAAARPALRTQITPPSMPPGARRFPSIESFVEEDPARALPDWPSREDATGADFGYDWTWQDPDAPWTITRWRVSYIDESKEVYARELPQSRVRPFVSFDPDGERPLAVWLLATGFEVKGEGMLFTSPTWEFLGSLQHTLMRQRNSLVDLARQVGESASTPS